MTHPESDFFTYARNAVGVLDLVSLSGSSPLMRLILDAAGQ